MSLRSLLVDRVRQRNASRKNRALSGQTHNAYVRFEDGAAVVDFGVGRFFVRSVSVSKRDLVQNDFAVFGLLILSLTSGARFKLHAPVSAGMREVIAQVSYCFEIWQIPGLFEPAVELMEIAEPPKTTRSGKVLCLSGGIDSTSAAIEAVADHGFTHGLLIAGADYPSAVSPGYIELRDIVADIARQVGLELIEVETDLRRFGYDWSFLHGLNLGMCLSYLSGQFDAGGIAMDNTTAQDLVRHPWGSTAALTKAMSGPHFPMHRFGEDADRVQKLGRISDFGGANLLTSLSVCWANTDRGTNCGYCSKCIRTRLNFLCAGVDESLAFGTEQPLEDLIKTLPEPKKLKDLRGTVLRTSEFMRHLPAGPVRNEIAPYYEALLKRLRKTNLI